MKHSILAPVLGTTLLAGVAVLTTSAGPAGPAPLPGPGGVLDLHEELFRAMDEGDVDAIRGILADSKRGATWKDGRWGDPRSFLAYGNLSSGEAFTADSKKQGLRLLADMGDAPEGPGGPWKTTITRCWADCPSPDISFAALQFERTRGVGDEILTERYRSTSLVSHTERGWELWHIHISPLD